MNNYEVNVNLMNFVFDPSSTISEYVPEFSHPLPPAIASVEYTLFFTEICSAQTSSFFSFFIDKFTGLDVEIPFIEIISFFAYEDKSLWIDNWILISEVGLDVTESLLLDNITTAPTIIIKDTIPNPKINFEFFEPVFEWSELGDWKVAVCGEDWILGIITAGVIDGGFSGVVEGTTSGFRPKYCSVNFLT